MNTLVIGSGGREHAIVWKISQSPKLKKLYALPGNPGTGECAENISGVSIEDHDGIVTLCKHKNIDLVIVGPEAPLAAGLVDLLSSAGIRCFGPSQAAAQIEASKVFAKDFMARHHIPTARYATFSNFEAAVHYLESVDFPVVIKTSGLAAGKGVILPETLDEAKATVHSILLEKAFGDAGNQVVIEERLVGQEVSLMAFTDGVTVIPMLPAQDHKRLLDGDEGPNTGGMGAYAPAPVFTANMMNEALETILKPTVTGLKREGNPFIGVLYAGLMLTAEGIRVLEFNCRFGDPETQVVLPLLESDLLEIADACVDAKLSNVNVRWKHGAAVCVVLASQGYPEQVESGKSVTMDTFSEEVVCFHAGTNSKNGELVTSGGRVIGLTARSKNINAAVREVYAAINKVSFEGMQYRADIGYHALFVNTGTDGRTDKRISDGRTGYRTSRRVDLPTDQLTYTVNGLAMQVHNELGAGHAEKFYQRRLADLCLESGIPVEMEKRIEVWVGDTCIGYLKQDLWIDERLVVECKSFSHSLGIDDVGQVLTYLAATTSPVGMLYNFGRRKLEFKRILQPRDVQDWQKHLYRFIHRSPNMTLPPLGAKGTSVPPIRFKAQTGKPAIIEIPSPTGAAIRSSVLRQQSAYSTSGVDIDAGIRAVELMKDSVRASYNNFVLAGIGSFGGLFDVSLLKQMEHPVLVASTDGVGTKVKLAASVGRHRGIGHDIVNHCINDILVQGARPLFFMDYFATSKLNPEQTAEVVTGIAQACKEAGMALLGGETAEMPGVYQQNEFDLAGTIVGVLEREAILPRLGMQSGDVLVGFTSSGPHTNGYSLIRKVFEATTLDDSLADALLAPHRSYFNVLYPQLSKIKALAHITGGGFIENIPRVLPEGLSAVIHLHSWDIPDIWKKIQQMGNISTEEMYRVFNMGIGMIAIVDESQVRDFQVSIAEPTFVIGELVAGERKVILN